MEPSRQRGEMLQADFGVVRLLLENAQALLLCERPPGLVLANQDQRRARCLRSPEI